MFWAFLAMAAAPSSDFSISDTTDNETGIRTVYALQADVDEAKRLSMLKFECFEHRPSVTFEFYDFPTPEWAVILLGGGDSADLPFVVQRVADRRFELRLHGDPQVLINELGEDSVRRFVVYGATGSRDVSFEMSGLHKAWQRVTSICR